MYSSCYFDKIPEKKQVVGGRVYFGFRFEGTWSVRIQKVGKREDEAAGHVVPIAGGQRAMNTDAYPPLSHTHWFRGDKVPQSGDSKQQEFILPPLKRQTLEIKL